MNQRARLSQRRPDYREIKRWPMQDAANGAQHVVTGAGPGVV